MRIIPTRFWTLRLALRVLGLKNRVGLGRDCRDDAQIGI